MADSSVPTAFISPTARRRFLGTSVAATVAALLAACGSTPPGSRPSTPSAAREYRHEAAQHLYAHNPRRIYQGKLPPMLYAVGVLEVELERNGHIRRLNWLRAPRHAPEVMTEIERTVRAAAPFPAGRNGRPSSYTDTWLWDRSGRFQLDTLTEGQLGQ